MVTRVVMGCACGMLLGMLVHAGVATGAEPGAEGLGRPMPPSYNPDTGGAPYPGPGPSDGNPYRGPGKHPSGGARGGSGAGNSGSTQKQEGSGDPLKGLNVHKATSSEDQKHQCHDAKSSWYYKC